MKSLIDSLKEIKFEKKINNKSRSLFTRQLATLMGSGVPLVKSLEILARQDNQDNLQKLIYSLISSVKQGNSFSDSLKQHPKVFNNLYVNLVQSGEIAGNLEMILERLAEYQEKSQRIQGKIVSAMIYPVVVLCIALLILTFLIIFIIPKFTKMFADMGIEEMPLLSEIVFSISEGMLSTTLFLPNFLWIFFLSFFFSFFIQRWRKTERGRDITDSLVLKIPIIGSLLTKNIVIRFSQTLGTLISSGVPILKALEITKETLGNNVARKVIEEVQVNIREGNSFSAPLRASKIFPSMLTGMVEMGEETGKLDEMLLRVSKVYEEDIDNVVAGITSILEVAMIIFLAVIVGTIVLALFLPLIKLIENFNV